MKGILRAEPSTASFVVREFDPLQNKRQGPEVSRAITKRPLLASPSLALKLIETPVTQSAPPLLKMKRGKFYFSLYYKHTLSLI